MKGDFSRGIQPDRKRGKLYRRVLLQQGRLLLDSDIAALVDAEDSLLRGLSQDTVGPSGSPDLGYFVTSGPLLAAFVPPIYLKDSVQSLSISQSSSTTFTGHLDYGI